MDDIKNLLLSEKELIDKTIEKWIPRKIDERWVKEFFGGRYEFDVDIIQKVIIEPFWDFMDRGGKRWRPFLFLTLLEAFGVDKKKYMDLVLIPEVIHNGSLVIDDIEDGSESRRGKPALHLLFGIDVATNVGTWMFFFPILILNKIKDILGEKYEKIIDVYIQEMNNIHIGQGMDIGWHKGWGKNITEKQYLQMCAYKTGTLARMSAKIAGICANVDNKTVKKLGEFAESIGIAFQIRDDILNIVESKLSENKGGIGEDITEGKRSLMVIHALEKADEKDRKRLEEILDMHTKDEKLIREAISILEKYDSIEYAKRRAKEILEGSWKEIENIIPENDGKRKLRKLVEFLIERDV